MYINPSLEYTQISEWLSTLTNKPTTPKKFVRRLSKYLNSHHPVRVRLHHGESTILETGQFCIGAEYDPNLDERKHKQFILDFIINLNKDDIWNITDDDVTELALELTEVLVHEYEHQKQYRKRRYKTNKEHYISEAQDLKLKQDQEYLGNPDEVDAYAANIAARFYILRYIPDARSKYICTDLKQYINTFGRHHVITKTLIRKIRENIRYFKENNHGKNHRRVCKRPRVRKL